MSSVRPCHNTRNFCEFCNTSVPVPETSGSSVRLPYPYPQSTNPTEHNLGVDASRREKRYPLSFYRPKDGKEDLCPHGYSIRSSSYSFHARVHGDLSVSIRRAFPYECGAAYGGRQQQIDAYSYVKLGNFWSGQLVKDSNLLNPLYLVSTACDSPQLYSSRDKNARHERTVLVRGKKSLMLICDSGYEK